MKNPIIFSLIIPIVVFAQEWIFHPDSLIDHGLTTPMVLNPFIEGYTPIIDYDKDDLEMESGKVYNGFQVQVIEVNNLIEAEIVRDTIMTMIEDKVEVVFDAPNYKVRAGAFIDRLDAEELRQKLYRLGYRRSWIVRARLTY